MTQSMLRVARALLLTCNSLLGQDLYAGALGGISTLSADGRAFLTPTVSSTSLYKPENGPSLNLFAGIHLRDYLSIQGNYVWNRNDVTLVSLMVPDRGSVTR